MQMQPCNACTRTESETRIETIAETDTMTGRETRTEKETETMPSTHGNKNQMLTDSNKRTIGVHGFPN